MDAFTSEIAGAESSLVSLKNTVTVAGGAMAALGAGGLAAAGGAFASFDQQLTKSTAIMGDVSDEMEDKLGQTAQDVAGQLGISSDKAAESYYFLASAGLDAAESMEALPTVAEFAAAGQMDMAQATDYATDVMKAFQIPVENMTRVTDSMTAAVTRHNSTMDGMGQAMSYVAPVAEGLGMSIEETSAAIGFLSDAGIKGSKAGTTLRQALSKLSNPTSAMQTKLDELGVSVTDSGGQMRDFSDILSDLKESGATTADIMELFGQRAGPGMKVLLAEGGEAISQEAEKIKEMGGITKEVAEKQLDTLNKQWDIFTTKLQNVAITIGGTLAPALTTILEKASGVVDWFSKINESTDGLAGAMSLVGLAIGGVATVIGTLLGGPLVGLAAGFAGIVTGALGAGSALGNLNTDFGSLLSTLDGFGARIMTAIGNGLDWLKSEGIPQAQEQFRRLVHRASNAFTMLKVWLPPRLKAAIDTAVTWLMEEGVPMFVAGMEWLTDQALAAWKFTREEIVPPLVTALGKAWAWLRENAPALAQSAIDFLVNQALGAWEFLREDIVPPLIEGLGKAWTWLRENAPGIAKGAFEFLVTQALNAWEFTREDVVPAVSDAIGKVDTWIRENGVGLVEGAFGWLSDKAAGAWEFATDDGEDGLVGKARSAIEGVDTWARESGVPMVEGAFSFLSTKATTAFNLDGEDGEGGLVPKTRSAIQSMNQWIAESGVPMTMTAFERLGSSAAEVFGDLKLKQKVITAVGDAVTWVIEKGPDKFRAAFRGIGYAIAETVTSFLESLPGIFARNVPKIREWLRNNGKRVVKEGWKAVIKGVVGLIIASFAVPGAIFQAFVSGIAGIKEWLQDGGLRRLQVAFANIFGGMARFIINDGWDMLKGALEWVFIDGPMALVEALYELLIGNSLIPDIFNDIADFIRNFDLLSAVDSLLSTAWERFDKFATDIWNTITNALGDIISEIQSWDLFGAVDSVLSEAWKRFDKFATDIFNTVKNGIGAIADWITSGAEGFVSDVASLATDAANGFKEAFNNALPDKISIPEASVGGGKVPGTDKNLPELSVGGQSIDIPKLASGGYVNRGGLAQLHSGEQVVPAAQVDRSTTVQGGADPEAVADGVARALGGASIELDTDDDQLREYGIEGAELVLEEERKDIAARRTR